MMNGHSQQSSDEWNLRMKALQTAPTINTGTAIATGNLEEQKVMPVSIVQQPSGAPMSAIKAAKNSIRKLAMFETYSNSDH